MLSLFPTSVFCMEKSTSYHEAQIFCLAKNVYYEARGEPTYAQKVVAYITVARAADRREWGKTPCETVYQKIKGVAQFSWTPYAEGPKGVAWENAKEVAKAVYTEPMKHVPKNLKCARYYKRTDNLGVSDRSAKWFNSALKPIDKFGNHTAYLEKKC